MKERRKTQSIGQSSNVKRRLEFKDPFFLTPAIQTVSHKAMFTDTMASDTMCVSIAMLTFLCVN